MHLFILKKGRINLFHNNKTKAEIIDFLESLNNLLRNKDFSIDFLNGTLYHNYNGLCGALDDEKTTISLLDDNTGTVIYETKSYKKHYK